jgi:hypothetical protein
MLLGLAGLLLSGPTTQGQPLVGDHSYVRGFTPKTVKLKNGAMVNGFTIQFIDDDLAGILAAPGYSAVDIVMQQCFAGAFVDSLNAAAKAGNPPAADWTACSASSAMQCSWGNCSLVPPKTAGLCDNFSRAWREDALVNDPKNMPPNTGMKQHFTTAAGNAGATAGINPDPFAVPTDLHFMVVPTPIVAGWSWKFVPGAFPPRKNFTPDTQVVPVTYFVAKATKGGTEGWWTYIPPAGWTLATPVPGPGAGGQWSLNGALYADAIQKKSAIEQPQYGSAGAASDARTLAPPEGVQQYAVLAQWDEPKYPGQYTADFGAGISRLYNLLTGTYGVPAGNIAILYYNGLYVNPSKAAFPAYTLTPAPSSPPAAAAMKTEALPAVAPIDGPSGYDPKGNAEFATDALNGDYFSGVPNFAKSRLFVYFNGHGCRSHLRKTKLGYTSDPNFVVQLLPGSPEETNGIVTPDGFDGVGEFQQSVLAQLASTNDPDLSDDTILYGTNGVLDGFQDPTNIIQISTTELIPDSVQLMINNFTNTTPFSQLLVTSPDATVYDLDPIVPGLLTNTYTYQVAVDGLYFYNTQTNAGGAGEIDLQFQGLAVTNFDPNLVAAVLIRGAYQEAAYVTQDFTATYGNGLSVQDYGGGILLTWPPGEVNYNVLETTDLKTNHWDTVTSPATLTAELTGQPDPTLPMGTNWAYFPYAESQMFYRLQVSAK